jgi:deoxyribonuclease-4
VGRTRVGLPGLPTRESPAAAVDAVVALGFDALELDFESGFWMDKDFAAALGEAARAADLALSVHAPIAAFVGHLDAAKLKRAIGMLDHAAGLATLAGAEPLVIHPGFLLGRDHDATVAAVVSHLRELRERLLAKARGVAFGIEMMGRVRDFGTADDVFAIASALDWVRPVIDFAHLHAVTDGAMLAADDFASVLARADALLPPDVPFHVHFSAIAYANRNETRHLPYGQGTLRAEPLRDALARFDRDATVVSESPDLDSHRAIRDILTG